VGQMALNGGGLQRPARGDLRDAQPFLVQEIADPRRVSSFDAIGSVLGCRREQ
jgi:hypothetical protein